MATPLYGCMGLAEQAQTETAVEAALEIGVEWFDHADIYGGGLAESLFGDLLTRTPGLRDRVRIQTKCGISLDPPLYDLRADTIRARVSDSLERLQVDYVDRLLLHRPDPLTRAEEVAGGLTALHAEGVVREVGVSNMSHDQIAALQAHLDLPLRVNQLEMSLHRRDWVEAGVHVNTEQPARFPGGTLEHGTTHGIALQAWGAMAQGRFTGRARTETEQATTALVTSLAEQHSTTRETVVLWWLQRHPADIAPVIGTTSPDRIRACADAVRRAPELTHEQWYDLWVTARGASLP